MNSQSNVQDWTVNKSWRKSEGLKSEWKRHLCYHSWNGEEEDPAEEEDGGQTDVLGWKGREVT